MATKAEIIALQNKLKAAGYDPGPIDGIYGPRTKAAEAAFNAKQGAAPAPANQSQEEKITALAMTQHGGVLAPYVADPEIRALLGRYVRGEIDDATLQGLVMQTKMWTTSTGSQRAWQTLEASDPASAAQKVQAQSAAIMAAARQQGVTLDQARADQLAKESLRSGWNETQLQQSITAEFHYQSSLLAGKAADYRSQVENLANAYGLPFSDAQKAIYVTWMVQGLADQGFVESTFRDYAKGMYPTLTQWFDEGKTLEQFADPYRQQAANTLGVNPQTVDWKDPKWGQALNYIDPKTNQKRPMTLDEWNQTMRSDERYGWKNTSNAKAEAYGIVLNLAKSMGRIA